MDKAEALRRFVKEHALKLTSPQATSDVVKRLRQDFFSHHGLKPYERFRNEEVAEEVSLLVFKKGARTKTDFVTELLRIPFVGDELSQAELSALYDSRAEAAETILKPSDLAKIGQDEYLKKIEEQFQAQARVRAAEEVKLEKDEIQVIREELARQREELEKFRSELDSLPSGLSTEDLIAAVEPPPPTTPKAPAMPWWKEVGLEADPFPSNQGLSGIPPSKYDEVVVQTPFIKNYLEGARQTPELFLGKTVLVVGEFGSGKTTLFQYLAACIAGTRILPISIVLNPHPSVASLTSSMLDQTILALSESFQVRFGYDPRRDRDHGDQYTFAAQLFKGLQVEGITGGFLVMVDGLHKGKEYTPQVLEFLQQIQNVQEFFDQRAIRIGFLIAGSPLWQTELDRRRSLSGSFYRKDTIPPLTADYAIEAVEKRIRSFVADPSKPPKVQRESLKMAFRVLSQRLLAPITFRDFLDHIRERLESRNYEEIGLTVALHVETVDAVHAFLRATIISQHYSEMWSEAHDKPALRIACQKVSVNLLRHGLPERDPLLRANRGALYLLRKHRLVVQRRSEGQDVFRWHLSPAFVDSVLKVSERLAIRPEEVVRASFEEETGVRSSEVGRIYGGPLASLREMIPTWKDAYPELAASLNACMDQLREIDKWMTEGQRDKLSGNHLTIPIRSIVDGINLLVYGKGVPETERWTRFKESWTAPENLESVSKFGTWDSPLPPNETALFGLLHEHSQVTMQLLLLLQDLVKGEGLVRLAGRSLTADELGKLHSLRLRFLNQAYRETIDKGTEMLEAAIRDTVYPAMRAVWGETAYDHLPSDVRETVEKLPERGHPRARRGRDVNFLYDVTRSEYTKILFQDAIYRALFGSILDARSKDKFKDTLELTFALTDRTAHRDRPAYFREHATEIGNVLQSTPWMLEVFHKIVQRFLSDCNFEFERRGEEGITGRFLPEAGPPISSKPIHVPAKEAMGLGRFTLERLAPRELQVDSLISVCASSTADPERQLAIVRALIKRNLIAISHSAFAPLRLSITDLGLRQLGTTTNQQDQAEESR